MEHDITYQWTELHYGTSNTPWWYLVGLLIHSQYVLITWRLWWHRDRWAAGRTPHWWQTALPRRWELATTGRMPPLSSSALSSGRAARLRGRDQSYYTHFLSSERHTPTHMIYLNKHVHHTRNCGDLEFKNTTTNTYCPNWNTTTNKKHNNVNGMYLISTRTESTDTLSVFQHLHLG